MSIVSRKRHILKTISYRIISTTFGFIFMYYFTGSIELSGAFSVVELVWKPLQYYLHERVWYKIKYGVKK
jgi:uncharacterized membrane protein